MAMRSSWRDWTNLRCRDPTIASTTARRKAEQVHKPQDRCRQRCPDKAFCGNPALS